MAESVQSTGTTERNPWRDSFGRASIRSAQFLLVIALLTVVVFAITKVTLAFIPIILALILTAAIAPVVKWLMAKGWPSALATGVSFLGLILIFGGVLAGIIIAVQNEWGELVSHAQEGFDQLYAYLKESPLPVDDKMIAEGQKTVMDFVTSSSFGSGALSGLSAVTSFAAGFVLMAVVLFFFLKDGVQIWSFFLGFLQGERHRKAKLAGVRTMEVLGGYVRGTAAVAGVDAVFIGGALAILQVPLALPLAVLTFVGGFIPLVGATAAGALAVLVALVANGPVGALIVLAVVVVVNQLEGNFLQPVLMGKSLNVHGLVILLALTVGAILAGIIGAVLSVPLTAVTWAVIKVWRGDDMGDAVDPVALQTTIPGIAVESGEETVTPENSAVSILSQDTAEPAEERSE
jgi:predicted PurR-regulated permease PerM